MSGHGLGPWQESYGVGSKIAPPLQPPAQEQLNTLLAQQRAAYHQDMMAQAQQMAYMGNMALGGLQMGGHFASASTDSYPRSYARLTSGKGLSRRGFMARTRAGLWTRKALEVLFWISTAAFIVGIALPLMIKIGTVAWTWALT